MAWLSTELEGLSFHQSRSLSRLVPRVRQSQRPSGSCRAACGAGRRQHQDSASAEVALRTLVGTRLRSKRAGTRYSSPPSHLGAMWAIGFTSLPGRSPSSAMESSARGEDIRAVGVQHIQAFARVFLTGRRRFRFDLNSISPRNLAAAYPSRPSRRSRMPGVAASRSPGEGMALGPKRKLACKQARASSSAPTPHRAGLASWSRRALIGWRRETRNSPAKFSQCRCILVSWSAERTGSEPRHQSWSEGGRTRRNLAVSRGKHPQQTVLPRGANASMPTLSP